MKTLPAEVNALERRLEAMDANLARLVGAHDVDGGTDAMRAELEALAKEETAVDDDEDYYSWVGGGRGGENVTEQLLF